MTRKRTGNSITSAFLEQCPMCEGLGMIKSPQTICFEIFRSIPAYAKKTRSKKITITVHSHIMNKLYEYEKELKELEAAINKTIIIKMQDSFYPEYFEIS
jgi:Ribonucleases G and E